MQYNQKIRVITEPNVKGSFLTETRFDVLILQAKLQIYSNSQYTPRLCLWSKEAGLVVTQFAKLPTSLMAKELVFKTTEKILAKKFGSFSEAILIGKVKLAFADPENHVKPRDVLLITGRNADNTIQRTGILPFSRKDNAIQWENPVYYHGSDFCLSGYTMVLDSLFDEPS